MKKSIVVTLVLISLLLLTSCAPKAEPVKITEKKDDVKIEEKITEEVKDSIVSSAVSNLLTKAEDIKSYAYLYGGPETANLFKDTFYCLGFDCSKMVIKFFEGEDYMIDNYYDKAFVSDNEAVGCCLDRVRCRSGDFDNLGERFDLDKTKLVIPKTPVEWINFFSNMNGELVGTSTFDKRMVEDYVFNDGEFTYKVKFDERFGVPHVIEQMKGEEKVAKYQFNDLEFNSWKKDFFEVPC